GDEVAVDRDGDLSRLMLKDLTGASAHRFDFVWRRSQTRRNSFVAARARCVRTDHIRRETIGQRRQAEEMIDFIEAYGTTDQMRELIASERWPVRAILLAEAIGRGALARPRLKNSLPQLMQQIACRHLAGAGIDDYRITLFHKCQLVGILQI